MPRKILIRDGAAPYHITSRANNKEWFYIPIEQVWEICVYHKKESEKRFSVKIEAFVLMSNHYHMLVYTPQCNIDKFMQYFNKNLGQDIARKAGRINRIFGASYKWNLINSQQYYFHILRYIYQNPLRANLVSCCLNYPYSDLKDKKYSLEFINWINQEYSKLEVKKTQKKLKHFVIDFP